MDAGFDLSSNGKDEADPSQKSQCVEDKDTLNTKKDQQFGWTDCVLLEYCAGNWKLKVGSALSWIFELDMKGRDWQGKKVTFYELEHY